MNKPQAMIADLVAARISQAEIGRRIGLPHWTVSRWAAGGAPESAEAVLALLEMHKRLARQRAKAAKAAA